jgi:hypothetical protein
MFPRPASAVVKQAGTVLNIAGPQVAGTGGINCTLQKTVALCANGTAKDICQWKAGVCSSLPLPVVEQLGKIDPLSAAPRLLNGLMLPYLLVTLAVAWAVMVRHTPLWRFVRHLASNVWNFFAARPKVISVAKPNYSVALSSGLFGNIPSTYDLQNLPPYDEVG